MTSEESIQIAKRHPIVFYDGHCGMCHGAVQFAMRRDPHKRLRFTPLQGETIKALMTPAQINALPDSIVLRQKDGSLHMFSDATLEIMGHLERPWPALADTGRLAPAPLRNGVYKLIARVRHQVVGAPKDVCPMVPREDRERFLP